MSRTCEAILDERKSMINHVDSLIQDLKGTLPPTEGFPGSLSNGEFRDSMTHLQQRFPREDRGVLLAKIDVLTHQLMALFDPVEFPEFTSNGDFLDYARKNWDIY